MIKIKQIENLHETIQKAEENAKQYANQNFEPIINKNTAFNKNFGTSEGTIAEGNHKHTFNSLTDKPNTLAGYGITDAAPKVATENRLTTLETSINYSITDLDIKDIITYILE